MPDSETLKVVIQAGSFGLMVLLFLWLIFRGVPMIREDAQRSAEQHVRGLTVLAEKHEAAIKAIITELRAEMKEQREWHAEKAARHDQALDRLTGAVERSIKG